jgi:hypothetical protein
MQSTLQLGNCSKGRGRNGCWRTTSPLGGSVGIALWPHDAPLVRSLVAPGTPTSVRVSNDTNDSPVAIPRRPLRTTTSFIFINWIDKLKAHRGTKDFHYFLRDRFDRLVETRSECADQAQHWSLARRRQIDMDLVQAIIKVRTELLCRG